MLSTIYIKIDYESGFMPCLAQAFIRHAPFAIRQFYLIFAATFNTIMSASTGFFTDSHAHIYSEEFKVDRTDSLERSKHMNVLKLVMPNVDHASIDAMMEVEEKWRGMCYATMGLHPCSVKKDFQRELYIVEDWLSKRKFAAVGEMGTDMYWDKTLWNEQVEAFNIQAGFAKRYKLPIIIHCRETLDETIKLIEQVQDGTLTGVFHCFGGTVEQAQKIARLKFYVGIGGVATFKKSGLDVMLRHIPLEQILLETDSPYLAPVPHRGKRNEPSYIPLIAQKIAEVKQVQVEEVMRQTTANSLTLFPSIV
ncbi:MAG TPA: TatD family hydrolase [Chryseosolibacter sp.]